jgi:quercetin dioxygenase-like cupin family protein
MNGRDLGKVIPTVSEAPPPLTFVMTLRVKVGKTNWTSREAAHNHLGKGPESGSPPVRIDLVPGADPARAVNQVTFEPGRTAWRTHPLGQTLIVTAGCGLAQRWGGSVEIRPGDVIWFAQGEALA